VEQWEVAHEQRDLDLNPYLNRPVPVCDRGPVSTAGNAVYVDVLG